MWNKSRINVGVELKRVVGYNSGCGIVWDVRKGTPRER
jgi:hypothetical protein